MDLVCQYFGGWCKVRFKDRDRPRVRVRFTSSAENTIRSMDEDGLQRYGQGQS